MKERADEIIKKLMSSGYEAYFVGGCVRDMLLGVEPNDFDITTNALPDEVISVFKDYNTLSVGKKFGTIIVLYEGESFEITTFRNEAKYSDSRHPDHILFSDKIEEDLKRRDFTINAMALDYQKRLIDIFNGSKDLENRIIRSVGNPDERFREDALRMIRAIRFASVLNFEIEETTLNSIKKNANLISRISKERIRVEINKILLSTKPSIGLNLLAETELLKYISEDLFSCVNFDQRTKYHNKTVYEHIMCVVNNTEDVLKQRVAALFHDVAKPKTMTFDENGQGHFFGHDEKGAIIAENFLKSFGYSNTFIKDVKALILEHMKIQVDMTDKAIRRQIKRVGSDNILDLNSLMISDMMCTTDERDIRFLLDIRRRIKLLLQEDVAKEKFLCIDGNDIKDLGYSQGKQIGEILHYLEEKVLDEPSLNTRETLLKIIKNRG